MALVVTAAELDLFMGLDGRINTSRADLVISLIIDDAKSVVTPLPDNAKGLVLTVASRVYGNPQQLTAESVGPFSVSHQPGAYLTRRERARLRRLAGRTTGAYTVDPTPADASPAPSWPPVEDWDDGVWADTWVDADE